MGERVRERERWRETYLQTRLAERERGGGETVREREREEERQTDRHMRKRDLTLLTPIIITKNPCNYHPLFFASIPTENITTTIANARIMLEMNPAQ